MLQKLQEIISRNVNDRSIELNENTNLTYDLLLDSLEITEIIADIEDTFHIQISDNEIWDMENIADIICCIENKLEK